MRRVQDDATIEQRLLDLGARVGTWANGPGETYPEHRHDYDKVLVTTVGTITLMLPEVGDRLELSAGDRLDLPAGTSHAAIVGGMGVRCLEAHLPPGRLGSHPRRVADWASDVIRGTVPPAETADDAGA